MIGSTTSFYDPDQALHPEPLADYHQFLQFHRDQQQQLQQQHHHLIPSRDLPLANRSSANNYNNLNHRNVNAGGLGGSMYHGANTQYPYDPSFVGDAFGTYADHDQQQHQQHGTGAPYDAYTHPQHPHHPHPHHPHQQHPQHAQQQQHPQHSQQQHQLTPQLTNTHAPGAASNADLFFYHQNASDFPSPPDVLGAGVAGDHNAMNAAHGYYQALQYTPRSDSQPLSTISGSGPEDGGGGGGGGGSSGAAAGASASGPTAGGGGNTTQPNTQNPSSGSGPSRRGSEFTPWPGTHLTANPQAYTSRPQQHQHLRGQQQSSSAPTSTTGTPPTSSLTAPITSTPSTSGANKPTHATTSPPNARGTAIATGKRNSRGRGRGRPTTVRKKQKRVDDRDPQLQYGTGVGGGGDGGRGIEVFGEDSDSDDSEYGDVPYGSYGSNTAGNLSTARGVGGGGGGGAGGGTGGAWAGIGGGSGAGYAGGFDALGLGAGLVGVGSGGSGGGGGGYGNAGGGGGLGAAYAHHLSGLAGLGGAGGGGRLPGACTHCKKLKMKCEFPKSENICKRCRSGGHSCVVEGRKPRNAPNKREYLLAQIRQKDAIIESLLKQLHNPYLATPMSIAAYRMASSPSDTSGSRNVLQWLERLQRSIHAPPHANNPRAWNLESRGRAGPGGDDDSESVSSPADPTEREREREDVNVVGDAGELSGVGIKVEGEEGTVAETLCANDSGVDDTVPLGLIAKLSLKNASTRSRAGSHSEILDDDGPDDDKVGLANEAYFMPGPASDLDIRKTLIERHSPPEILVHGLVTPDDVEKLFDIFYTRCNPFLGLLDPVLHTPASTFARCPFLFTVVCAVSSRYYREKSDIYAIAMHFAKHAAATALIDGWKSVELCQAYILMSVYAVPARRWEEDRSWLYTGLAIRIATDLNLHQVSSTKPTTERAEREILNRTRVWMICFNLDRSTATQFGKPSTIKEDYIIRNSKDWYKKSKYNHMYDVHLCAYSSLLRIVAKFHEEIFSDLNSPSGLNENLDFRAVTLYHDEKLEEYFQEWTARFNADSDPDDKTCKFRCTLLPFLVNYSRLVMFSFGFQQAFRRGIPQGDNVFFDKCLASATQVVKCVIDSLGPSGYLKFAPDGHFVFASFASAFLLKLLRPDLSHLLSREQANQILSLIGKLIQVLGSSEVSIDDRHTPKLHARFLAGLLAKHQPEGSSTGRLHPQHPPEGQVPEPSSGDPSASAVYPGGVAPSQGSFSQQETSNQQGGSNAMTGSASMVATPIYEPEATYAAGTGPLPLTVDTQMYGGDGSGYDASEEVLATMQALRNPAWWDSMMMPGFSWPDAQPTPNTYATHMSSYANAFPQPMHFQTAEVGLI